MDQDDVKSFYNLYKKCWDDGERTPEIAYALSLCSIRYDEVFEEETYDELIKDCKFIELVMIFIDKLPQETSHEY